MSAATGPTRPWYREPWPWLLMLPPAFSVAGGVAMVYLAVGEPAELAVPDYSRIEELTTERFARDERAAELQLAADVLVEGRAGGGVRVFVRLTAADGAALPATLNLQLQHVARSAADHDSVLVRDAANVYFGAFELAAGRYDLELSPVDRSWRLGGSLHSLPATLHLRAAPGADR